MPATKTTKRKVNYLIRSDLVKRIKHEAVDTNRWPSQVIEDALEEYLKPTAKARQTAASA